MVNKFETTVAMWYKNAPHLSASGRRWLTINLWWIVLIGLIIGALGVVALLSGALLTSALLTAIAGGWGAILGGLVLLISFVILAVLIVQLVLGFIAIGPLKEGKKKGWTLIFVILLIRAVVIVLDFIAHPNIFQLVWDALFLAVMGYFLFEVREEFSEKMHKKAKKVVRAKA